MGILNKIMKGKMPNKLTRSAFFHESKTNKYDI